MRYSNVFICFLVDKGSINKVTIGGWGVIQNAYRGRGDYGKHQGKGDFSVQMSGLFFQS